MPSPARSTGTKRPHDDDRVSSSGRSDGRHSKDEERRSKPKDWRDAFLDEDDRRDRDRHTDRDRERERDRDRPRDKDDRRRIDGHRGYDGRDGRDGRCKADYREQRDRDRYRDRDRDHDRSKDNERRGDRSDRRRDDHDRNRSLKYDREEGEIEPSPPKPPAPLPTTSPRPPPREPAKPSSTRRPFLPVNVPTQPRSNVPVRPPASNVFEDKPKPEVVEPEAEEEPAVYEEEKSPEQILEERRRKREEIMAKFRANGNKPVAPAAPEGDSAANGTGVDSVISSGAQTGTTTGFQTNGVSGAASLLKQLGTRSVQPSLALSQTPTISQTPALPSTPLGNDFDLSKGAQTSTLPPAAKTEGIAAEDMISAGDYDPTEAAVADQAKRRKDLGQEVADGVGEPIPVPEEDEYEEVEIEEEEDEMDMFAAFGGEEREKKKVKVRRLKNGGTAVTPKKAKTDTLAHLVDNLDDSDGYYRITPGETLDDGRYQVATNLGKGMFSAVVKAKVLKAVDQERRQDVVGKEVAIKVIRSQESMYVAGRKEAQILQKLKDADPEDKKHIVRLERTFEHRGHLCIVTESLSMNLRDVIKRFGKDVGLNTRAVRAYAHQMFLALSLMKKCNIVHADIKPDNVLVSENKATLKVCDLGSASDVSEGEITPYLVSRFYRAPEIILGLPFDTAIDMWSVGCTLFELYTGKILFPGRSNNQMLFLMMELKGKFNRRMIKKATFGEMHFDENANFISVEVDKITGNDTVKTIIIQNATKDLKSRLLPPSSVQVKMKDDELKDLLNFVDLIDKCLALDPLKRLTPREALGHPFVMG